MIADRRVFVVMEDVSMTKGPHDYTAGTRAALFHVAVRSCYFPECEHPIIEWVGDTPVVGVDICHIRGGKPGAARYDDSMTDAQRASFENLVLLCSTHHKIVDRLAPDDYPVDVLESWKAMNEAPEAVSTDVTYGNLEEILESLAAALGPHREVEVDLLGGVVVSPTDLLASPLDDVAVLLAANPHLSANERVVVANVRNVGSTPVSIESIDFMFVITSDSSEERFETALMGRNDFGPSNPQLPYRLDEGDAVRWLMKFSSVDMIVKQVAQHTGQAVSVVVAEVKLGTGEKIRSVESGIPS